MTIRPLHRLAIVMALGALGAGCATATRAQAPVERPSLEVPPAPPRVIEPAPLPEVSPVPPNDDLPPPPPDPKPMRRTSPRETSTAKETPKPDPNKPDPATAQPETPATPVAQNVAPAPQLRTPATADTAAAEKEIRDTIQRGQTLLNSVVYQKLSGERQKEYQNVKDFLDQANAALKNSDLELAKGLAANAEKLARELQNR